ncbi:hypothetical protein SLEP1_g8672 [Rubroshorea leprosula]|uniref:S1 motif domain-containing protein n=1 Tax=Rubroshorea leprosula TaxID=152421 RepID=A0AAV5I824_9ROSI|nr:hypothetical protein SLEP1_g8672 [Rubroshorea leprosula]
MSLLLKTFGCWKMDGLGCTAGTTTASLSKNCLLLSSVSASKAKVRRRPAGNISFTRKTSKFRVWAEKEEPKLDKWDQMELKFGRLIGEDPKLTLAKIMGRKVNPEASYLEIEKSFYKNKGKEVEIKEVPFDVSKEKKSSGSSDGLNLVRPVPKKGFEYEADDKPEVSKLEKPTQSDGTMVDGARKGMVPNVILRKPTVFNEDDVEDKRPRYRVKPNLSLKMWKEQESEKFSDITLLKKPELMSADLNIDKKQESLYGDVEAEVNEDDIGLKRDEEGGNVVGGFTLLEKPEPRGSETKFGEKEEQFEDAEMKPDTAAEYNFQEPIEAIGVSVVKKGTQQHEQSDSDWARAESLLKTGERTEVEFISSSTRGFVVSFGSLIGFLPYRNLASRWKFLAFESWLRQKGLDPSKFKQNLGVIGSYDVMYRNSSLDSSIDTKNDPKFEAKISPDMKLEDLLRIYDQEKLKFLSSFVGQIVKANVVIVERRSRKLIFSLRPKEKEEFVEKKRNVMAKLRVGDVVKCCVKKITYFGIFVEVEGVPALIHQSEVSWDTTLDPASFFKVGQILEAKVHQLDFALERIFLSLKEIMPDPLIETLESVVGGHVKLDGRLEAAQADTEWPDVESLIKELQQIVGIQSVLKGRFFLSPGLAPTFQVYMASTFENQYKLLARSGNKVQEVIVEASLSKEEMKSTILSCTNRVE